MCHGGVSSSEQLLLVLGRGPCPFGGPPHTEGLQREERDEIIGKLNHAPRQYGGDDDGNWRMV